MTAEILILGGGYAGLVAAARLGKAARDVGAKVTLVSPIPELVERIRLHQWAVGQTPPRRFFLPMLEKLGVEFVAGKATRIHRDAHAVDVKLADGSMRSIPFTQCIHALGSITDRTVVPGVKEHAFTLDPEDVPRLLVQLKSKDVRAKGEILVVGGGLTGVETATEIAEQHPDARVRLLCAGPLIEGMSNDARTRMLEVCATLKVTVMQHVRIVRVTQTLVELADGSTLPHALCIWAAGMCAPSLARDSGLRTDAQGRLIVDATLRSPDDPAIVGAGDSAHALGCGPSAVIMGCKAAMPMGAHAADVVKATLQGREPPRFSFSAAGYCVSLGRRHAVVERMDGAGGVVGKAITGRLAIFIKEMICRATWWAIILESKRPGTYAWLKNPTHHQAAFPTPLTAIQSAPRPAAALPRSHTAP